LKVRHGRTPSITVSPSQSSPPKILLPPGPEVNGSPKKSPHMTASITQSPGSGTSTPSSVGFVSLSSLNLVNGKLRKTKSRTSSLEKSLSHLDLTGAGEGQRSEQADGEPVEEGEEEEEEKPNYLRWDGWLDSEKYAVLPNDWPYNVPTGVRHYCVWSRVSLPSSSGVSEDWRNRVRVRARRRGHLLGRKLSGETIRSGDERSRIAAMGHQEDQELMTDTNSTSRPSRLQSRRMVQG